MPEFPLLGPPAIYSVVDDGGSAVTGTPDSASLHRQFAARNTWIADRLGKVWASWVDGPDATVIATSGSITVNRDYDFGTFALPAPGCADPKITVAVYIEAWTTANTTYYAQFVILSYNPNQADVPLSDSAIPIGAPGATGWISADLPLPTVPDRAGQLGLRITATATAATNQKPASVCIYTKPSTATLPDGHTSWAAWEKHSLTHAAAADRPDDTASLHWLARAQGFVAGRYGRTLGCHSFNNASAEAPVPAGSQSRSLWYRFWQGPDTTDHSLRLYALTTIAAAGAVTLDFYIDGEGAPSYTTALADSGGAKAWTTHSITAANFTANTLHSVEIRITATNTGAPDQAICAISAISLEEGAFTDTDYVYETGGRNEHVPEQFWGHSAAGVDNGKPIVASYKEQSTVLDRWSDKFTLFHNAVFNALYRQQTQIADWVWRAGSGAASGYNGTVAAFAAAETLWAALFTTTRDSTLVEVWIRLRRGIGEAGYYPKAELYLDTSNPYTEAGSASADDAVPQIVSSPQVELVSVEGPWRVWQQLGSATIAPNTTAMLSVRVGWVDANGVSAAPVSDYAVLDGVLAVESRQARGPDQNYWYGEATGLPQSIPDFPAAGRAITFTVPADVTFTVRHARVYIATDHGTKTQLDFYLDPPGAVVSMRFATGSGADGWWSSDIIGDNDDNDQEINADILGAPTGTPANGDWIVTIVDTVGGGPPGTGNIIGCRLELW